jgi:hypothetical protein
MRALFRLGSQLPFLLSMGIHIYSQREFGLKAGATFEYKIEAWSLFGRSDAAIFSGRTPLHDPSTVTSSGSGGTGVSCEANSGELLSSSSSLLHQGWLGTLTGAIWQVDIRMILQFLHEPFHLIVFQTVLSTCA